jgi:hypothetical protein
VLGMRDGRAEAIEWFQTAAEARRAAGLPDA